MWLAGPYKVTIYGVTNKFFTFVTTCYRTDLKMACYCRNLQSDIQSLVGIFYTEITNSMEQGLP